MLFNSYSDLLDARNRYAGGVTNFAKWRTHQCSKGIVAARSGEYDLVVSAVAIDERNGKLEAALQRSGIGGFEQWGRIFRGSARFAVFTHQKWVDWVRDNGGSRWGDWLSYVTERYDLRA